MQPKTPTGVEEVWLYLSGGGLAAALASLGSLFYFYDQDDLDDRHGLPTWRKISRITSVSGGSLENAALLNARGRVGDHFFHSFERFVRHGSPLRYPRATAGLVCLSALVSLPFSPWWPLEPSVWSIAAKVLVLVIAVGLFHLWIRTYGRERIGWHIGAPRSAGDGMTDPEAEPAQSPLHIFSTVDVGSGLPTYYLAKESFGNGGSKKRYLAHDRTAEVDRFDFYRPEREPQLTDIAYASAAWPVITIPWETRAVRIGRDESDQPPDLFRVDTTPPPATEATGRRSFKMLDGGLSSTLGSRIDPQVFARTLQPAAPRRGPERGLMDFIHSPPRPRGEPLPDPSILRVIVDAGNHDETRLPHRATSTPLVSALVTVWSSIQIALSSQITLDRRLADVGRPDVWYLPTTGHGRQFTVRVPAKDGSRPIDIRHPERPGRSNPGAGLLRRSLAWIGPEAGRQVAPLTLPQATGSPRRPAQLDRRDLAAIDFVDQLRARADGVGLFVGRRRNGLACMASGTAGAFVEAYGIGGRTFTQLERLLRRMERATLHKGGLDPVFRLAIEQVPTLGSMFSSLSGYRWTELEMLFDGNADLFVVSHQGDRGPGERLAPNSLRAFERACRQGVRVLECDVQGTKDGELIGLHTVFGWYRTRRGLPAMARLRTKTQIDASLGRTTDTIGRLIESIGTDATWNFEAKGARSMRLLLDEIGQSVPLAGRRGVLPGMYPRFIVSGGWMEPRMRQARRADTALLTAGTWREKLRLLLGRQTDHVAVIQLPSRFTFASRRIARRAEAQRIQVQWFGVGNERRLRRVMGVVERAGIISNQPRILATAVEEDRSRSPVSTRPKGRPAAPTAESMSMLSLLTSTSHQRSNGRV